MEMRMIAALAIAALAGACGGPDTEQGPPPAVDVSGTWQGTVTSTDAGTYSATLTLSQVGPDVTGTYAGSVGLDGSIQGTVSGTNVSFVILVPRDRCSVRFVAGAEVVGTASEEMALAYNLLSTCGGPESGTATLTRR